MNRVYGYHPWQMPRLTQHELTQLFRDMDKLSKANG